MAEKTVKKKLTAFRVEPDLKKRLDSEPNSSRIMNIALRKYYETLVECPACGGSGKLHCGGDTKT